MEAASTGKNLQYCSCRRYNKAGPCRNELIYSDLFKDTTMRALFGERDMKPADLALHIYIYLSGWLGSQKGDWAGTDEHGR